jgi:hypothetical protein
MCVWVRYELPSPCAPTPSAIKVNRCSFIYITGKWKIYGRALDEQTKVNEWKERERGKSQKKFSLISGIMHPEKFHTQRMFGDSISPSSGLNLTADQM